MAQGRRGLGGLVRDNYLLLVDICGALFLFWAVSRLTAGDLPWVNVVQGAWLVVLILLYPSSRRDEFIEHCWRTATSATFLMLIASPLLVAFGEGLMMGFASEHAADLATAAGKPMPPETPTPPSYRPSPDGIVAVLFATFLGAFQWTRFRGSRI